MIKFLVDQDCSLISAMQKVDKSGLRSLVVIDKKKKLLGTLTDGDIRRSILRTNNLSKTIKKIFNKKPAFVFENNFSIKKTKEIFEKKNCDIIPVINENRVVKDVILSKNFSSKKISSQEKNLPIVIMAGGYGIRLKPFTNILPKPLIPVKGKAVLEHIIDFFSFYGYNNFNLIVHYKYDIIRSFLKSIKSNLKFNFFKEKTPLGTAGGLNFLKKKISGNFILTNSDTIFDLNINNFVNFHKKNNFQFSMIVTKKKYQIPYGICDINQKGIIKKLSEKPNMHFNINSGLYILNSKCLKYIPKTGKFDITELINKLLKNRIKIGAYFVPDSSVIDVGKWSDFNKLNIKKD